MWTVRRRGNPSKKIQPSDIEACIFQNARAKVNALEIVHVLFNAAADRV